MHSHWRGNLAREEEVGIHILDEAKLCVLPAEMLLYSLHSIDNQGTHTGKPLCEPQIASLMQCVYMLWQYAPPANLVECIASGGSSR